MKHLSVLLVVGLGAPDLLLDGGDERNRDVFERISGYTRDGAFHPADMVISNADVANTYMKMIPGGESDPNSTNSLPPG